MDIEEKLKRLEFKFGVAEEKEPTTLQEFLEQFPDYEELIRYITPEGREILSKYGAVLPSFEGWSEVKIRRAERCQKYYYKLHPEGIQGAKILEKYIPKRT